MGRDKQRRQGLIPRGFWRYQQKKRQKNIVYVADPGLGHVVSFRMGLQII